MTFRTHVCAINLGEKAIKCFWCFKDDLLVSRIILRLKTFKTINFYLEKLHPMMTFLSTYFGNTKSEHELKAIMGFKVAMVKEPYKLSWKGVKKLGKSMRRRGSASYWLFMRSIQLVTRSSKDWFNYLLTDSNEVIRKMPRKYIAEFIEFPGNGEVKLDKLYR